MKTACNSSSSNKVVVFLDEEAHETEFEGTVAGVEVNGTKLNDVHDLACRVVRMTRTIRYLAVIATSLALMAVLAIGFLSHWLISHESQLEELLLTNGDEYAEIKKQSANWRSHQRHRAYVTLRHVLGYEWNPVEMEWEEGGFAQNSANAKWIEHSRNWSKVRRGQNTGNGPYGRQDGDNGS